MSRNGNCDAKHHGNASAGTMVRLQLVFAARMCLQAVLDLFCMSSSCISWTLYHANAMKGCTEAVPTAIWKSRLIHQNTSLYILFHAILSYLKLTNPHKHICCEKKKSNAMADTHLSIETTYIAYPICYTTMLPNMPFRKADAHPLRLNTRCKDLTLVPSTSHIVIYVSNDINGYLSIYISWYHVSLLYILNIIYIYIYYV